MGGRLVKAKRRVVTSGGKAAGKASGGSASAFAKRRPTIRKVKPAIAPGARKLIAGIPAERAEAPTNGSGGRATPSPARVASAPAPSGSNPPLGREVAVDLSVDLGR